MIVLKAKDFAYTTDFMKTTTNASMTHTFDLSVATGYSTHMDELGEVHEGGFQSLHVCSHQLA